MSSNDSDLDQARRDDIADLEAFEARFPPEAFEHIAREVDGSTE